MKIKLLNWLIIIDIATVLLVLIIALVPHSIVRTVLGLPFLLFLPGCTMVAAFFPLDYSSEDVENLGKKIKGRMSIFERLALSFSMSIVMSALIVFGLNFSPWGITFNTILYSMATFIIVMSVIAIARCYNQPEGFKLNSELFLRIHCWEGSTLNKALTVILIITISSTIGVMGYAIAKPKVGEHFSEFYLLGRDGKAESYPTNFIMAQGVVNQVSYDGGTTYIDDKQGKIILGIINQEQKETAYRVDLQINGQNVVISYDDTSSNQLEEISLEQGVKWEKEISFTPQNVGDNQKVEFFLYKDGDNTPIETLHFWLNIKGE